MNTRKEQVEIYPLFPTPVVVINIGRDFTKDELLLIEDIPMRRTVQNHQSKDLCLFDNWFAEGLKDIKKFCEYSLKNYLENIEGVDTDLATLRITQAWLNTTKPNEMHQPHLHPNSYLSGVFYFRCLPNDNINFNNRMHKMFNNMELPLKKSTPWNATGYKQNVKEGDLIIFPSWIPHFVNTNETKKERISLSFNTFPKGEMGNYNDITQLFLQ
jgi:uncharacterized protein (TIGR02466 family)